MLVAYFNCCDLDFLDFSQIEKILDRLGLSEEVKAKFKEEKVRGPACNLLMAYS